LSYAADKQTDKQTVFNILPTPTDVFGVGNNMLTLMIEKLVLVVILHIRSNFVTIRCFSESKVHTVCC